MATVRRVGAENSATREQILKATEELIATQGYAEVSTRKVAARAGLKPSLVHYYFPTTDDLWLAVYKRGADKSDEMIDEALCAPDPLKAMWEFLADSSRTGIALEFMALANHRPAIRAELAAHSERMRQRQVEALERLYGDRLGYPPAGLSLILAGIGRALYMEGGLGVTGGHEEARAMVEQWLGEIAQDQGVPR